MSGNPVLQRIFEETQEQLNLLASDLLSSNQIEESSSSSSSSLDPSAFPSSSIEGSSALKGTTSSSNSSSNSSSSQRGNEGSAHVAPSRRQNNAHQLGGVNVAVIQRDLIGKIAQMREVVGEFRAIATPEKTTLQIVKKYQKQLKDHAIAHANVTKLKGVVEQSLKILTQNNDQSLLQSLANVAEELKLQFFADYSSEAPKILASIAGAEVVVDALLEPTGRLVEIRISENIPPEDRERFRSTFLKNLLANSFESFKANLGLLSIFDQAKLQFPKVDFLHSYRALETDLLDIFQMESSAASGDMKRVLLKGHGLVNTNTPAIGPCVTYYASPLNLMACGFSDANWMSVTQMEGSRQCFHHAHFSIEEGKIEVRHIDSSRKQYFEMDMAKFQQSPKEIREKYDLKTSPILAEVLNRHLEFLYPTSKVPGAPILYVMLLDPPVKASMPVARKLLSMSSKEDKVAIQSRRSPAVGDAVTLEESLLREFEEGSSHALSETTSVMTISDDSPQQAYHYVEGSSPGFVIKRIPFQNPMQTLEILLYLRQQLVFNELFLSTLRGGAIVRGSTEGKTDLDCCDMEVSTAAPALLSVIFPHPHSKNLISLDIEIALGGNVSASCQLSKGENEHCTPEYVTKLIQTSMSIPMAIRSVYKHLEGPKEAASKAAVQIRSSKRKREDH